jgi:uncharacterized protein
MVKHGIELDSEAIRAFCKKWKVRELFLFGSILRDDFRRDSDVDLMFELEEGVKLTLDAMLNMESELAGLLGRRVDLVPRSSVEQSDNYIKRRSILNSAERIVGA